MDSITLSDRNEYLVVGKTVYNDNTYYFLVDEKNNANIKFCLEKIETKTLVEIDDINLTRILVPLFSNSTNLEYLKANLQDN